MNYKQAIAKPKEKLDFPLLYEEGGKKLKEVTLTIDDEKLDLIITAARWVAICLIVVFVRVM